MLLSTGKTNAATPINSAVGIGETRALQAHLGNNLASATTLVLGNSNTVLDTVRTGDWKFYVAGNTSVASVTGASASSEWTGGSLLSYNEIDYYMFYPFNTNTVSGNTLLNNATNSYDATLYGGASIINTVPSPAAQPPATGSGYLEMNVGAGQYAQLNQSVSLSQSGSTISVWFRWTNNITNAPVFQYGNGNDFIMIYMSGRDWCIIAWKIGANQGQQYAFNSGTISASVGTWVHVAVQSSTGNVYANGILYVTASGFSSISQPTYFYFGNYNPVTSNIAGVTADFSVKAGTISMDNFVIYNKTLTAQEIGALYAKSDIYYTFDSDSVSGTSIGNKASGTYVNDATLVNSASIGTTNPSSAPTSGTGHLQVTSANNIATNQYVQLTFQPSFLYLKNSFSVSFWARSNSSLGSSAKNNFFDFANSIAASENANYSFSMYLQSNNIRGKISHGASGIATNDYVMYTDSSILTDNVWRHYVWTVQGDQGQTVEWKFYVNSVLVYTKTGGFVGGGGVPTDYVGGIGSIYYTNSFIGRDAGSWQTASFTGAIDEFRWYKSRVIGQSEVTNLYATQVSVGKFQNPSGGNPTWIAKPSVAVDSTETSYTVKSNEIALAPGVNSTYAVWTAPKSTNIRIDVSFADYNSRSAGVGFQMFKINSDNTFGSVIFPRTVTSTALTNANPTNYLSVPSRTISVATGDKIYYRIDANGNATAASSVLATAIYTDPNQDLKQFKYLQANLGNNIASTSFVGGNANVVNDTLGTGNWKFYVAGNTSIASITGSSASSEWTSGSLLSYAVPSTPPTNYSIFYPFDSDSFSGTNVGNKATGSYVNDAVLTNGATISTSQYKYGTASLYLNNPTATGSSAQNLKLPTFTISQSTGFSVSFWIYNVMPTLEVTFLFDFSSAVGGGNNMMLNTTTGNSYAFYSNYSSSSSAVNTSSGVLKLNQWSHVCITISTTNFTTIYVDSVSVYSGTPVGNAFAGTAKTGAMLGATYFGSKGLNGYVDDFKIYNTELTSGNVSALYSGPSPASIKDITSGVTWLTVPGTAVDANETSYTVKSNEIALTPGTNSTFAVWTATKLTNIKVDVSFADYHTRSSGVGFQMFKIKANNTFDSVLFPRTVTTAALTNAAPNNYLSVPTITTTVNVGDKLYYRIDGNGNAIVASSVFATAIYTDDVSVASNPVETRVLQAQLATNMNSTTFVFGNSNSILDTIGTGDWKFYVAGNTSVASITSSSASTEWSSGSILGAQYAFDGTLMNGATVVVDAGSRVAGNPYLKILNSFATSPENTKYAKFSPVSIPSGGMSFSMWVKHTIISAGYAVFFVNIRKSGLNEIFLALNQSNVLCAQTSGSLITVPGYGGTITNGNWHHLVWTISASGLYNFYLNNSLISTNQSGHPGAGLRDFYNIGSYGDTGDVNYAINGGVDNFKIFTRELTALEVTAEYNNTASSMPFMLMTDSGAAPKWTIKPATLVDATETSYTVKSNEIALAPGTNSTYAVWTAPKSTNLKIDVSFADYNSRSAGVGFQMFKINSDNTFGSVIFPRTVTSTALTNANPTNYLSVPSRTISVATGDKIYYRVDANGNPTSASSVLATNIYVDPNQDLKQYKYLQAHLGNNMSAVSFVAGNANVVNDTRGTGNWNFYVAGNTSIASVTGASASSEWTVGNLLSYNAPINPDIHYTFDTNSVSGTSVGNKASGTYVYDATLVNGASIGTTNPSSALGTGHLQVTSANSIPSNQYVQLTFQPSFISQKNSFSVSFWARSNNTTSNARCDVFNFSKPVAGGTGGNFGHSIHIEGNNLNGLIFHNATGTNFTEITMYTSPSLVSDNTWRHYVWTVQGDQGQTVEWKFYVNSVLVYTKTGGFTGGAPNGDTLTSCFIGRGAATWHNGSFTGAIDEFKWYKSIVIGQSEVSDLYTSQVSVGKFQNPSGGNPTWIATPGTVVNASETNYTVKSNEIALTPGTNSTYAVWTATKSTNLKIDVSFADYHTRSSGVGFQMFKIKSDNTFDSVLFPRTVTSAALTNAAPNNYLTVPTINTTVNAGDKLYYRVDANGNTTSASSVLATAIYTDDVSVASNPVETRVLQANLGNNLASATLVAGNTNTVLDTVGNGDWKFYVAGNTSVASISSASASTEWITGNLLSYSLPSNPPVNYNIYFPFETANVSGSTVADLATGSPVYSGNIVGNATIVVDAGSRVSGKGYLSFLNRVNTYFNFTPFNIVNTGLTIAFWGKFASTVRNGGRLFDMRMPELSIQRNGYGIVMVVQNVGIPIELTNIIANNQFDNTWRHYAFTITYGAGSTTAYAIYVNGSVMATNPSSQYPDLGARTTYNIGTFENVLNDYGLEGGIDDFQIYQRPLSPAEVTAVYVGPSPALLKHTPTGATWMPTPATVVDSSETSYTVKSNEIALAPGTNSTYAVWTAPKSTNIRIDVSFADYHSRSAGVGFQMFKINNDNTFGSVIFPRTVTSTALTNANPTNYLSVPSRSLSVSTGDKIYYRIDANGNTTAASSVLATNIYTYSGKWS